MFIESDRVELKQQLNDSIKKEIVAFANTDGGKIYVGINDEGKVIGLDNPKQIMEAISSIINDSIRPDLRMFTAITRMTVEIEVLQGTKKPYHLVSKGMKPSGVFIRHGVTSQPASEALIRQMIYENEGTSYEQLRSLSQNLTFDYTTRYFEDQNIKFEDAQKRTLGIINEDCYYTNLGLLLSEQCEHSIKCASYNGINKLTFKDRKEFKGSLLKQLDDTFDYISMYNKTGSTFEGLKRVDKVDYPFLAIREALINAIVHRDYSFSGSILIHIFDDRIEFVSTGAVVSGLTKEDIMSGISESRNGMLANCFYRLELIESYGTGIQRIYESYDKTDKKPHIKITDHVFLVTLPNMNYVTEEKTREDQVIELITTQGDVSRAEIENVLDISKSTATIILNGMIDKKMIRKVGTGKKTIYKKV